MSPTQRARLCSLLALFAVLGIAMSSWASRTATIRDLLSASPAEMGLVLFGLSIGSMTGVLGSGALVRRFGTRPIIATSMATLAAGLGFLGLGSESGSQLAAFVGLLLMGLTGGGLEVAANVDAADLEVSTGATLLPRLHGMFSLGTAVGAATAVPVASYHGAISLHLLSIAVICLLSVALTWHHLLPRVGQLSKAMPLGSGGPTGASSAPGQPAGLRGLVAVWTDRRLLMIGAVVLAMAFAEGSANDWLTLLMVDEHGLSEAMGSLVFFLFVCAMTFGRFGGHLVIRRYGAEKVMRTSAVLASLGIAGVIFSPSPLGASLAVACWGLGAALGFPVAISAAARGTHPDAAVSPGLATVRVGAVASVGYLSFLAGPPLLGSLAQHVGLSSAMLCVLITTMTAIFTAKAVAEQVGPVERFTQC